jgi:hypothetical protein
MNTAVLVDGRNIFNPDDAIAAGFDYAGIGRRPRGPKVRHEVGALHQ